MTYRELTADEKEALEAFAAAHGRNWRDELGMVYWYNARIWRGPKPGMGPLLHGIRNEFGPTWLYDTYKLPKNSAAGVRVVRINRDSHYDEFRVPAPDGREGGAYYTNDKSDAEETARAMYAPGAIEIRHTHGRHPKGRE